MPNIPPQTSHSAMVPAGKRKQLEIGGVADDMNNNQLNTTPNQVPNVLAAPPTTIASLAEENQILMKYLQKK